ncbi:MAG: OmpA family protein [Alphaproteobacteria bacterium]|nr:OmpA family protein [Alphaproteobacteria bacterium]
MPALAILASLALSGCESSNNTEAATNSLPIRVERSVTGWFGATTPPPPVVENPPIAEGQAWPRLGSVPPVPRVAPVAERRAAIAELTRARDEALAENARLAAGSPFLEGSQGAAIGGGTAPPAAVAVAPALAPAPLPIAAGRSVGTVVFDPNSTAFGEPQRQAVRAAAAQLAGGSGRVRVIGFAGAGLAPADGASIARARAQAVAAELQAAGIAAARLAIEAPGQGSGRQVEIVVDL